MKDEGGKRKEERGKRRGWRGRGGVKGDTS